MSKILLGLLIVTAFAFSGGQDGFVALTQFTPSIPAFSEPATMMLLGAALLAALRAPRRA